MTQVSFPASSRPAWRWAVIVTVLAATVVAFVGGGESLPLDGHELFVARGTEEMLDRSSYLVPFINGQPRLKKPPMNNWLIAAAESVAGDRRVSPFEARLPSVIGGVVLVLVTLSLGSLVMDRPRAWIGALLVASSSGYLSYTHSARPEMLYAAWSMAGLLGFVLADRALRAGGRAWHWSALGWFLWALATLTKGPQIPLILVVGVVVWQWRQAGWRSAWRVLRPELGLPLFVLVCGAWVAAVWSQVPHVGDIWQHETAMRFSNHEASWWSRLHPYYFYRTAALVSPWVVLFPLALLWPGVVRRDRRDPAAALWWCLIVAIAMMSLVSRPRWYYMLPLLPPLALLMSDALLTVLSGLSRRGRWIAAGVAGCHAAALVVMTLYPWNEAAMTLPLRWAATGCIVAAGVFCVVRLSRADRDPLPGLAALVLAGGLCFATVAFDGGWWEPVRQTRWRFACEVAALVPPGEPLLGWMGDDWIEEAYASQRVIVRADDLSDLSAAFDDASTVWVLAERLAPGRKRAFIVLSEPTLAAVLPDDDRDDDVTIGLWRIERGQLASLSAMDQLPVASSPVDRGP